VRDHLRVSAGRIEQRRVRAARDLPSDFEMSDAVVYSYEVHVQGQRERPRSGRRRPQAWPEARPLGERDEPDVVVRYPRLRDGLVHQRDDVFGMMVRGLPWVYPALGAVDHLAEVREDLAVLVHDSDADRVRGPFDAEADHPV
jgi:hypothetical protein